MGFAWQQVQRQIEIKLVDLVLDLPKNARQGARMFMSSHSLYLCESYSIRPTNEEQSRHEVGICMQEVQRLFQLCPASQGSLTGRSVPCPHNLVTPSVLRAAGSSLTRTRGAGQA